MYTQRTLAGIAVALVLISAVALAAACNGGDDASPSTAEDGLTIRMTDDLSFTPDVIRVTAGRPATLVLDNSDSAVLHDFTVEDIPVSGVSIDGASTSGGHMSGMGHMGGGDSEAGLHIAVEPGEVGTIEFTPLESGEFEVICTEPGHANAGMVATLVVE